MSNKKQTAVEFLEKEYYENDYNIFQENFEQAKAMHKEEMIIFAIWFTNRNNENQSYENIVEQYYKE
jgi:hypothetical protein